MNPPIALVGMGGMFPGGPDLAAFWSLIRRGQSAIREVPAGRWILDPAVAFQPGDPPGEPGPDRVYALAGGFLDPFTPGSGGIFAARRVAGTARCSLPSGARGRPGCRA